MHPFCVFKILNMKKMFKNYKKKNILPTKYYVTTPLSKMTHTCARVLTWTRPKPTNDIFFSEQSVSQSRKEVFIFIVTIKS